MSLPTTLGSTVVERAARGDEAAFARLVAAYHADLLRVAYVVGGADAELAQDAVQATWVIAWHKLGTVRDPASVKGWLVAIAANEARQLVRRQHRRTIVELRVGDPDPAARDECRDVPQTDPSAADDAEAITCDRVVTDARLSGTILSEGLPHGVGQDPALYTAWARLTLTNDGGTWSCDEVNLGVIESGTGWRDQVCVGEGAYKGVTAYIHSISNDSATTFGVLGWVEETP